MIIPRPRAALATALGALCLGHAASAHAATSASLPTSSDARTFATSNGGWTSTTTYSGIVCVAGLTCPTGTGSFVATGGTGGSPDGFLRNAYATSLASLLSDTSITRRSPAFALPADVDQAKLFVALRPVIGSLLTLGGSLRYDLELQDNNTPADSVVLARNASLQSSSVFTRTATDVPAGALTSGHSYSVVVRTHFRGTVAAIASGHVDIDDVELRVVDLEPPSGLSASASSSGALRINGSVDPNGQSTSVKVLYGPQGQPLSSATAPVEVMGDGAKAFSIPLAGLTPGVVYDYQVVAASADGSATTATASLTAPTPPGDAPPVVGGAGNSRERSVSYHVGQGTVSARAEVLDQGGAVIATVDDPDLDGELTVTLPDADGAYQVRIVRTSAQATTSTSTPVGAQLDRVAPSLAGAGLSVSPATSADVARSVSYALPADAIAASLQVLDGAGAPVRAAVTATGSLATVQLGATDGIYRVRLTATDAAGNSASTVSGDVVRDSTAPSAGGAPTVTGAGNSRDRQVTFTRDPTTLTATIEVLDGQGDVVRSVPVGLGASSGTITLPDADGTYWVRVRQTDVLGNESITAPAPASLDRDAPDPATPTISGASSNRERTVSFQRDPSAVSAELRVFDAAGAPVGTPIPVTGSSAEITLPDADGTYFVRVAETDAAGNQGVSAPRGADLDRAAPDAGAAPRLSGDADNLTVSFDRAADAISAVVEILDASGNVVRRVPVTGAGASVTTSLPAGNGTYTVRVVQADAAGNTATSPAAATRRGPVDPAATATPSPTATTTPTATPVGTPGPPATPDDSVPAMTDPGGLMDALPCLGGPVSLTEFHPRGGMIRFAGVTAFAAGTSIRIHNTKGETVATATASSNGRFETKVRLPRRHHERSYQAAVGSMHSQPLRIQRTHRVTSLRMRGRLATVRGRLGGRAAAKVRTGAPYRFMVFAGRGKTACAAQRKAVRLLGRAKVDRRTGAYRLRARVPAGTGPLVLRTSLTKPVRARSQFLVR